MYCNDAIGERYDFVITADQPVGAYWIQARGLGECGVNRVQQLAVLRYARGPYQPATQAPTYDVGLPQGVVSTQIMKFYFLNKFLRKIGLDGDTFQSYSYCLNVNHIYEP